METELQVLLVTAASLAFVHTILGPDHYIPFVMMSRAGRWNHTKTGFITFLCGLGHVGSSILIGSIGIALGVALQELTSIESFRGDWAAWLLFGFGTGYFVWSMVNVIRKKQHTHLHIHPNGTRHSHPHQHQEEHMHVHKKKQRMSPWILFVIFVFGPCEPLIPLLMYPAAEKHWTAILQVSSVFAIVTIGTMMLAVFVLKKGLNIIPTKALNKFIHPIAGATIALCGASILFLGL